MCSEYLRRSFFVVLYGLYFVMSDAGCTTEVINGEEKVPVPATELTFYFRKYAKFRAQPQPKDRPKLPEWHTFREVTLNICYFYHNLTFPPCFCSFPSSLFSLSDRHIINDAVLFFIYKIGWEDYYYRGDTNSHWRNGMLKQCLWTPCTLTWVAVENQ